MTANVPAVVGANELQLRLTTMLKNVVGLSDDAAAYLCANDGGGLPTVESYLWVSFDSMMTCLDKVAAEAKTATPSCVINHPARHTIRAFRAWLDYRDMRKQTLDVTAFTRDVAKAWAARCCYIDNEAKRKKIDPTTAVEKFKNMEDWENFSLDFHSVLSHYRSTKGFAPLTYVIRDDGIVLPEDLLKPYLSIDEDLTATASHLNDSYGDDNRQVYDLFSRYFSRTTYQQYIQPFHRSKDGRSAYMAIRNQALGTSAIETRSNQATNVLISTKYDGDARFTYDQYVAKHLKAHHDLFLAGETVSELRKVQYFTQGIRDKRLEQAVLACRQNKSYRVSFEETQLFIKDEVLRQRTSNKDRRNVSGLQQASNPGRGAGRGNNTGRGRGAGRNNNNKNNNNKRPRGAGTSYYGPGPNPGKKAQPRIRAGHYERDEFNQLSAEE